MTFRRVEPLNGVFGEGVFCHGLSLGVFYVVQYQVEQYCHEGV
jgi:hypothetical protein